MNIPNVTRYIHAYRIAPWRVQRQWVGAVLLAVVAFALVAALYLNITSRAAIAGREIQDLMYAITISQQVSADMQTQLASLTSVSVMERRARELGFRPMEPEEVEYLVVPGYSAPQAVDLSSLRPPQLTPLTILPEYNQSLLEWFDQTLFSTRGMR